MSVSLLLRQSLEERVYFGHEALGLRHMNEMADVGPFDEGGAFDEAS